jgi:hypothetical protein
MSEIIIDIPSQNIFGFENIFIKILKQYSLESGITFNEDNLNINEKISYHSMEMGRDIPPNSPYAILKEISYSDKNIFLTGRIEANYWNESEIANTFLSFELKCMNDILHFYSGSEKSESIERIILKNGSENFINKIFLS